MNEKNKFCAVFDCMDGRCQDVVSTWCHGNFDVKYLDTITKPGIDKILSNTVEDNDIKMMAEISAHHHGSKVAVIVGHAHCAGNVVSDKEHEKHVRTACKAVSEWGFFENIIGLFVNGNEDGLDWDIKEVCRI